MAILKASSGESYQVAKPGNTGLSVGSLILSSGATVPNVIKGLKLTRIPEVVVAPIGGKIFHIESGDNGATYTFYDSSGNEVHPSSTVVDGVEHLNSDCANIASYKKIGNSTFDKFYVVGIGGDDSMGVASSKHWTYWDTTLETPAWKYESLGTLDGIGKGKYNTNNIIFTNHPEYISAKHTGQSQDTIWYWINQQNNVNGNGNGANGCSDWFIGSKSELEKLRTTLDHNGNTITWNGTNDWFSKVGGYYIWSSFEYSATNSWYWNYNLQGWFSNSKITTHCGVALRAF